MNLSAGLWALVAVGVLAVLALGGVALSGIGAALAPGLDLRGAALWAAGLSVAVMVVFALVAGDGLIGEIQFVLPGFFVFFLFNWLLIAWVF